MGGYYVTIAVPFPIGLFASAPTITDVMGRIGTGLGFGTGTATQNNATISIFGNQNTTTSYITNVSAIGRWK